MSATFCRPFARQPDATRRVIGHGTANDVSSPHGGRLAIERSAGGRDACTEAGREWEEGLDKGGGRSGWRLAVSDLSGVYGTPSQEYRICHRNVLPSPGWGRSAKP